MLLEVNLRRLFTPARPGERPVVGKIDVRAVTPEQVEEIEEFKKHCSMNGGRGAISIAYFAPPPKRAVREA